MGKTKSLLMIASVILMVTVLLAGGACPKPAAPEAKVLKIGSPGPLSGMAAGWGVPEDRGMRLVIEQVNAAGGLTVGGETYTFEVISGDTKFTVEGAAAVAHKMVTVDNIKYALGGIFKFEVLALSSVFEPAGVVHIAPGPWGSGVVRPEAPHFFRGTVSPQEQAPPLHIALLELFPDAKRWAFIGTDTPGARECSEQTRRFFPAVGLEVTIDEYFPVDAVEFYPLIAKILKTNPDAIEVSGATPMQDGLLAKQLKERGFTGLIMHPAPLRAKDIVEVAGVEAAEGFLTFGECAKGPLATPEVKVFSDAYVAKYGLYESAMLARAVDVQILMEAWKAANTIEGEEVVATLQAGGPFDTLLGPALVGGEELHGIPNCFFVPRAIQQIQNGELVALRVISAEKLLGLLNKYLPK